MAAWASWHKDILPIVRGCPDQSVNHALLRAAQEFFQSTRSWNLEADPIAVTSGDPDVTIESGDTAVSVFSIESAVFGSQDLDIIDDAGAIDRFGQKWEDLTGSPVAMLVRSPGAGRLIPEPDADGTLKLIVKATPSDTATGIPDDLYPAAREGIQFLATAKLLSIPGSVWSNDVLAAKYEKMAQQQAERFCFRAATRFSRARISARPQWF